MILVVWLVECFSVLIIVLVRFVFLILMFMYFCAALGTVALSVVIDLGFCGVSMTALRLSSDHLFSASRRTLRAYTTPSSVRTKCSSVRSLLPSRTPSVCQFWCGISRSLSDLWKMCKNCFSKRHQCSSILSAHGTIEWGLHITVVQSISSRRCRRMVCFACALALLPTLFAPVPAAVFDSFRLLHCFDVTVWVNFE